MKRSRRGKRSRRQQYSFFDYILIIGLVALFAGGIYYFMKGSNEAGNSQAKSVKKKPVGTKPDTVISNVLGNNNVNIKAADDIQDKNSIDSKPPVKKKSKKEKSNPESNAIVEREDIKEKEEPVVIVKNDSLIVEPEHINIVMPELTTALKEQESLVIEPVNEIRIQDPSPITQPVNRIPVQEPVAPEQTKPVEAATVPIPEAKVLQLDAEDILPEFFTKILEDRADILEDLITPGHSTINFKEASTKFNYNALHFASMTGKLECLRVILKYMRIFDVKIDGRSGDKPTNTALLLACANAHYFPEVAFDIVSLLLEHGADIELADTDGYSPLFAAIQSSHLEVVNLLLERGANVKKVLDSNNTVLHIAMRSCNRPILKALIGKGADIHAVNLYNREPIHEAAFVGCVDGLRELIITRYVSRQTLSPAMSDSKYSEEDKFYGQCLFKATPLHFAACSGKMEAIEFLFLLCSDYFAKDEDGKMATEYADTFVDPVDPRNKEVRHYFFDRNNWERDRNFNLQGTIGSLRRLDLNPNQKLYNVILNTSLHSKREYKKE